MAPSDPEGQRRTRRVVLRVPLEIEWQGSTWSAVSAVVNHNGALILSPVSFPEGTVLDVANKGTGRTGRFSVVWCGGEDLPGRYKLGLAAVDERPGFWGPEYESLSGQANSGR